ncbi:hypothetical protein ACOJQI_19220 [Bacillus salacetis]|uniref:hypothetical protein n=1 Tax=Bacillus salacetis TaxID=2315464 RepID=UPI003BA1305C
MDEGESSYKLNKPSAYKQILSKNSFHSFCLFLHKLIETEGTDSWGISGTGETPQAQPRRLTARPPGKRVPEVEINCSILERKIKKPFAAEQRAFQYKYDIKTFDSLFF